MAITLPVYQWAHWESEMRKTSECLITSKTGLQVINWRLLDNSILNFEIESTFAFCENNCT